MAEKSFDYFAETQQRLAQHYAKTIYFNTIWRDSFLKAGFMLCLFHCYQVYQILRPLQLNAFMGSNIAFCALCMGIEMSALSFGQRWLPSKQMTVRMFQLSFVLSLMQAGWIGEFYYERDVLHLPAEKLLLSYDSIPFGLLFFLLTWISDRYMVHSEEQAKISLDQIQKAYKKSM